MSNDKHTLSFLYPQVDVPIHIGGSDSAVVRFEGRGLSSLTQDSSNHCNSSDCQAVVPSGTRVPFPGQVRLRSF